jgi:DNA-binding response OmpR family regulator
MNKSRIFVLEDEQDIRDLISFKLKADGYQVYDSDSADQALDKLDSGIDVDLFIVDWMLPGHLNGLEFTKKIRANQRFHKVPIIMLTALTQPENIVAGLDAGADDYMTKPFDLQVLSARVRVQLRSAMTISNSDPLAGVLEFNTLKIETAQCRTWVEGEEINLTSTEFKILLLLAEKPGHVFTRAQFINSIQGENIFVTGRTIDTHIAGLRKKLGLAANMIETIRGIGYRFKNGE